MSEDLQVSGVHTTDVDSFVSGLSALSLLRIRDYIAACNLSNK